MLKLLGKYKEEFYFYYIGFLLVFIPLYPKFPFVNIPGSSVSLRIEDFLVFIAGILLLYTKPRKLLNILRQPVFQAIVLFWVASLVSTLSAIYVTQTVSTSIAILHWIRRIEYMSMFVFGYFAVRNKKDLIFYIKCLVFVVFYAAIYAAGQKYYSWPVITTQNSEYAKGVALRWLPGGHVTSTFAGHYDLATYLILILPIFFGLIADKGARREVSKKGGMSLYIIVMGVITAGYWLLINAASRISIVSYLGVGTLMFLFMKKFKYIPIFVILGIAFLGLSSNLMDRYMRIFKVAAENYLSYEILIEVNAQETAPARRESSATPEPAALNLFEDRSTSIRLNVEWPRAVRSLTKNPLLGTGYSSITLATDNDYLRMLGETGLAGFLAFGLIVFRVLRRIIEGIFSSKLSDVERIYSLAIFSALFGIFLNMIFIDILEASKFALVFWMMLGFLAVMLQEYETDKT